MKYIIILGLLWSSIANAQVIKWKGQSEGTVYKSTKSITLYQDERKIVIPAGTKYELYEVSALNMIKVHLHKYKIDNCPGADIETDLQLFPITQPNRSKISVGINIGKGCNVEIFIDMNEYNTYSHLK